MQTDIWVRYQRLRGHDCLYVCASDAHGTPIMLKARQEGITPEALIERVGAEHRRDFAGFDVALRQFHTTHSPENREVTERHLPAAVATAATSAARPSARPTTSRRSMFLPDRFVRGTCPRCGALDQYGDSCETCGATYTPADLIERDLGRERHAAGAARLRAPVLPARRLRADAARVDWLAGVCSPRCTAKLDEWFTAGLRDWDISRDAPYFGFEIPGAPGKYFYVWLDAPIGYIGSFRSWLSTHGPRLRRATGRPAGTPRCYHFIGKDIVYFHTLFWPAVLHGAGYRRRRPCTCTASSPSTGRRCPSRAARSSPRAPTSSTCPPEYLRYYYRVASSAPASTTST